MVTSKKPSRNRYFSHHRPHGAAANPLYGYGYNPAWPSILSIAHDEQNSACVYVITDRPCYLQAPGNLLPLEFYTGLNLLWGEQVADVKFKFQMSAPVVQGSNWRWGDGPSQLHGAGTGLPINPGAGSCADFAGPNVPIPTASVVQATPIGNWCTLRFDRPIVLPPPPITPDGSILIAGAAPVSVNTNDPYTLSMESSVYLSGGEPWEISAQPGWIITPVSVPQGGTF